jgi:hypothetical protein
LAETLVWVPETLARLAETLVWVPETLASVYCTAAAA